MARNAHLEAQVRTALAGIANVEEKRLFRGTAFMVNEKLCISAGNDELMFRFDPSQQDTIIKQEGCREMLRNGKPIKGYVYVHTSALKTKEALHRWVKLALDYNSYAKATPRKTMR